MTEEEKKKEQEFLEGRIPFYLDDNSSIVVPTAGYRTLKHVELCDKYHYSWHSNVRGYVKPDEYAMMYIADYEIPNVTAWLIQYVFNKFPDIKWIGLGCNKGKIGEYWRPRMVVVRDNEEVYKLTPTYDLSNKPSEEPVGE